MTTFRRIDPGSTAKLLGLLYALIGLLLGALFSFLALVGGMAASSSDAASMLFPGFIGVGAILVFPILYGLMGLIAGFLMAILYNLVAGWVGGIRVELTTSAGEP